MATAEITLSQNQEMQGQMVTSEVGDLSIGMWMGFASFLSLVGCALLVMLTTGYEIDARLFLAAAAISLVGLFVKGCSNGD
jgi:hypothetical protein